MSIWDHLNSWVHRKISESFLTNDAGNTAVRTSSVITGSNGNEAEVNDSGQLKVVLDGKVDTNNSTTTPLAADGEFTGTATDTLDYALIFVTVTADVASATDGLCLQTSTDGTTWIDGDCFTIAAGVSKTFSFQPNTKYARIHYTNGSTIQTSFDLQTIFKKTNSKPSSHRIKDSISPEDDATLQKSVVTAQKPDGTFINIGSTDSGNLKVTDAENGLAIAKGEVTGSTFVHKFGNAPDFDTADGIVTVWDGADDGHVDQMRYIYSTTAAIDSVSSSSTADTFILKLQGLDENWELIEQSVTLSGQTRVALTTPLIRVFRMKNDNGFDNTGHIYCYENTAISGGVPTDSTKVRCIIQPGNNQTLMAVYTIPAGKTGYVRDWYASTAGASKNSQYILELRARQNGKVFQLKHISSISDLGTSYIQHRYEEPEKFTEMVDIEMRVSSTEAGATGCSISAGFDVVLVDD